jgi:hypothetical protein
MSGMISHPGNQVIYSFAWYLDLTPNKMFSLNDYPIPGKDGLPLCEQHGRQLELKEVVLYDEIATEKSPPGHCWVCADR